MTGHRAAYLVVWTTADGVEHRPSTGSRWPYRTRAAAQRAADDIMAGADMARLLRAYPSAHTTIVATRVVDANNERSI